MSDHRCRSDRREAWLMGIMSTGMLIIPLVAWAMVQVGPEVIERLTVGHVHRNYPETHVVGACRAYCSAQVMYRRVDWDGDGRFQYASPLSLLHDQLDGTGQAIQLIDQNLAAATLPGGPPKMGYVFREIRVLDGGLIDCRNDYALCATPAVYGRTGRLTMIVATNGTVWAKDLGRSEFVTDFPADPAAAGWVVWE